MKSRPLPNLFSSVPAENWPLERNALQDRLGYLLRSAEAGKRKVECEDGWGRRSSASERRRRRVPPHVFPAAGARNGVFLDGLGRPLASPRIALPQLSHQPLYSGAVGIALRECGRAAGGLLGAIVSPPRNRPHIFVRSSAWLNVLSGPHSARIKPTHTHHPRYLEVRQMQTSNLICRNFFFFNN